MREKIVSLTDAVTEEEFGRMIGKPVSAISDMRKAGKLPVIQMKKPDSVRGEYYVYLPAWNAGMKLAYDSLPREIRDGWLLWLGLGDPA
ncbi:MULTISPECIES: Cox family DNA-binding protein [Photorhabdus]|uniref:Regulatory phage protein cox n=1 Tax=Photorhabdus temperata subsp. temperata Meg1 TaxID=1393735 RepID=A0A081S2Q0_PHOTE|nr:Cox family DNA-binding protein [Photorhabdus temperata]KER05203.1 Regulatory phage protein cox [Photorhabdus temperata subsp. temperata Meg1]